jgi:NAD(P)-dependent dehydrogenase (short-subunit alcohol dehydrogenase family)
MGTPEDVAKAVAFLISDDAEYINAVSLPVEGGTMALPPW